VKIDIPAYYIGKRYKDSLEMHKEFANKQWSCGLDQKFNSYHYKFPPYQNVIDALDYTNKRRRKAENEYQEPGVRDFVGMNPLVMLERNWRKQSGPVEGKRIESLVRGIAKKENYIKPMIEKYNTIQTLAGPAIQPYIFDSSFESGNLDMVVQVGPREFDLYMRVDANTRGHH